MADKPRLIVFDSPIGFCGFVHFNKVIQYLRVGFETPDSCSAALADHPAAPTDVSAAPVQPDPWESKLIQRLVRSLHNDHDGQDDFLDVAIADEHLTEFQKTVSDACRRIGFGQTISYGELASEVGRSGAARAVGSVMSRNRFLLIVPCHRVLSSNGLGGYSSPRGTGTKKQLLEIEGHAWPPGNKTESQAALFDLNTVQ